MQPCSSPPSSSPPSSPQFNRIPTATYRVQLRKDFGFAEVEQLLDYLHQLGISDLYLSPLFRAREDSSHGYDVVDHGEMASEFGGRVAFDALARRAAQYRIGILLDIVPNHMGVNDPRNAWWNDVLRNGPNATYAEFFDIDWERAATPLNQRVLLPVLGETFGEALESGSLVLQFERGEFCIHYGSLQFPVTPVSWPMILQLVIERLSYNSNSPASVDLWELLSVQTQLQNLPAHPAALLQSDLLYREQMIASHRLQQLMARAPKVTQAIQCAVDCFNNRATAQEPKSWERLESLLDAQWYRLAYWRVAADEINYRRFFDINDLAAIRVDRPAVFHQVHALIAELLANGQITGLRIDHVDGLLDPELYLEHLQKLARSNQPQPENASLTQPARGVYVVVEKILSGAEQLPNDWQIAGTTGYELLTQLNLLQISAAGLAELRGQYPQLTGVMASPRDIVYQSKLRIIDNALSSELQMLANQLYRLSWRMRSARDFTLSGLLRSLREIIACFPVYRTYIRSRGWEASQDDHSVVMHAVRMSKLRNPTMEWSTLDFVGKILLLQFSPGTDAELQEELRSFVLRFQQVTGPITAKGTEDTAGYRYFPLTSINEVGSELDAEALSSDEFHRAMQRRGIDWPHALSATATHDTKRGEDMRARINVLSEIAPQAVQGFLAWAERCLALQQAAGHKSIPGRNELYLLYQTLIGTWPTTAPVDQPWDEYRERINAYMLKAVREAKQHTSWANPAKDYEQALQLFVDGLFLRSSQVLCGIAEVAQSIASSGLVNSLSQTLLKMTVPGVPDFYQGTEYWDFRLVDPDNRRPVDFVRRAETLAGLLQRYQASPQTVWEELWRAWPTEAIKQFLIWRVLNCRQHAKDAFDATNYTPLTVRGKLADKLVAFLRPGARHVVVVLAMRQAGELFAKRPIGTEAEPPLVYWEDTTIQFPSQPPTQWHDQLSDRQLAIGPSEGDGPEIAVSSFLGLHPVGCWLATRTDSSG